MNDTYITLTGWVGSEVSLREVTGGATVATFRVASTSRRFRNNEWSDGNTTWYQVKAWRRLADHVAASVNRGEPVVVHGRLEADVWKKEDGSVSTQLVVTATSVGHDLSHGTGAFTKQGRPDSTQPGQLTQEPVASDPWMAPLSQSPAFAQDAPTPEPATDVEAA